MLPGYSKIKGVFPGAVLSGELKKRRLDSKQFALSLGEYPQTIYAINKGRRGINPELSVKFCRIFERETEKEIKEIISFYGEKTMKKLCLNAVSGNPIKR